jgi:16S rRNA (cytosine1402-N4)-methyltransferase
MKTDSHIPVLLKEAINLLKINKNGIYVDCTAGRGGHSQAILMQLSQSGTLVCIDTDLQAISYLNNKFKTNKNVHVIKANFSQITKVLNDLKIKQIDGLLADLGVSSPMFDDQTRGFSYHQDNKLDMRMDQTQTLDAEYVVNHYSPNELARIFKQYGEINNPSQVVKNIIESRNIQRITTTGQLVEIIKNSLS